MTDNTTEMLRGANIKEKMVDKVGEQQEEQIKSEVINESEEVAEKIEIEDKEKMAPTPMSEEEQAESEVINEVVNITAEVEMNDEEDMVSTSMGEEEQTESKVINEIVKVTADVEMEDKEEVAPTPTGEEKQTESKVINEIVEVAAEVEMEDKEEMTPTPTSEEEKPKVEIEGEEKVQTNRDGENLMPVNGGEATDDDVDDADKKQTQYQEEQAKHGRRESDEKGNIDVKAAETAPTVEQGKKDGKEPKMTSNINSNSMSKQSRTRMTSCGELGTQAFADSVLRTGLWFLRGTNRSPGEKQRVFIVIGERDKNSKESSRIGNAILQAASHCGAYVLDEAGSHSIFNEMRVNDRALPNIVGLGTEDMALAAPCINHRVSVFTEGCVQPDSEEFTDAKLRFARHLAGPYKIAFVNVANELNPEQSRMLKKAKQAGLPVLSLLECAQPDVVIEKYAAFPKPIKGNESEFASFLHVHMTVDLFAFS